MLSFMAATDFVRQSAHPSSFKAAFNAAAAAAAASMPLPPALSWKICHLQSHSQIHAALEEIQTVQAYLPETETKHESMLNPPAWFL